jgi:hypothetical protein
MLEEACGRFVYAPGALAGPLMQDAVTNGSDKIRQPF